MISIKLKILIEGDNELTKYNGKTIIFKDSYLLLPVPLRKLALTYKCSENKGIFPYKLTDILYKGVFPAYKYWTGITLEQHLDLSKQFAGGLCHTWSFKDEAIKYCQLDCLILHQILTQFNELIFNKFKVNILWYNYYKL